MNKTNKRDEIKRSEAKLYKLEESARGILEMSEEKYEKKKEEFSKENTTVVHILHRPSMQYSGLGLNEEEEKKLAWEWESWDTNNVEHNMKFSLDIAMRTSMLNCWTVSQSASQPAS